jgi:hypothetical protein
MISLFNGGRKMSSIWTSHTYTEVRYLLGIRIRIDFPGQIADIRLEFLQAYDPAYTVQENCIVVLSRWETNLQIPDLSAVRRQHQQNLRHAMTRVQTEAAPGSLPAESV